jgi:hypothetical protein
VYSSSISFHVGGRYPVVSRSASDLRRD